MCTRERIIAVDFDGCLCENAWPDIGDAKQDVIDALLFRQKAGAKIILWTCRVGDRLDAAVKWCADHGIVFDAVNANLPVNIAAFGNDCRKVFADEYWDDKACNPEICNVSIPSGNLDIPPMLHICPDDETAECASEVRAASLQSKKITPQQRTMLSDADFQSKVNEMEQRRLYVSTVREEIIRLICERQLTIRETADVFSSINEEATYNFGRINIARVLI